MKNILVVTADTNDGDYITENHVISDEDLTEFISILKKLLRQTDYHGNETKFIEWETGDIGETYVTLVEDGIITQEESNFFYDYIPSGEHGVHTITNIKVLKVTEEIEIL